MNHIYFMNVFFKSMKIWIAGILSILTAEVLHLDFSISAGVVAILSVAPTKKETLKTIVIRFYTFSIAMCWAYVIYKCFGYTIYAFLLFLGWFILICNFFEWQSAIAINSVLVSHFLTFGSMEIAFFLNEFLLFLIGSVFAIGVNLHLHQNTEYITLLKTETDEQIKIILERMSYKIATDEIQDYNGDCFKKLNHSIEIAKNIAYENYQNQWLHAEKWDFEYMVMREQQIKVLYIIYQYISKIKTVTQTTNDVSAYLYQVSKQFHTENTAIGLLEDLKGLMTNLKESKLPETREEFEDRALLFLIMQHMEEFLQCEANSPLL